MPKRGDFDHEYDEDQEKLLQNFEIPNEEIEDPVERKKVKDLQDMIITVFNYRLDERLKRKRFVLERGILDVKRLSKHIERKKCKEERDLFNAMKVFSRYNTHQEHEKLVNNLWKER